MPTVTVDQTVFVPSAKLPNSQTYPRALHQTRVASVEGKRAKVDLKDGAISDWIAKSKLLTALGLLVVRIGDFATEDSLLDPLSKSLLQFNRLLADDSSVKSIEVRALTELRAWWRTNGAVYSHVILIGHGAPDGVIFGVGGKKTADQLAAAMPAAGSPKIFVSLCCETGRSAFAKSFSQHDVCHALIAPFHSIPGATSSQFVQTYLTNNLLEGRTSKIAFRDARAAIPGTSSFRFWKNGRMST